MKATTRGQAHPDFTGRRYYRARNKLPRIVSELARLRGDISCRRESMNAVDERRQSDGHFAETEKSNPAVS